MLFLINNFYVKSKALSAKKFEYICEYLSLSLLVITCTYVVTSSESSQYGTHVGLFLLHREHVSNRRYWVVAVSVVLW